MKKKSALLAAAISGMMLGAAATAQASPGQNLLNGKQIVKKMADKKKGPGKGKNDCKGKGGCKTDKHECAGKNDCKGQGGCDGSHGAGGKK
jgi:hypothetical protein